MPERTPKKDALEKAARNRELLLTLLDKTRKHREGYPDDVIMLHATSVESLVTLIETGKIPGRSYKTYRHKSGDLFAYPIFDRFPDKDNPSAWVRSKSSVDSEPTRDDIVRYANLIAPRHYTFTTQRSPARC